MMYSDDLLMAQDEAVLPLVASLVLAACAVFGYPISWKKLQLGPIVKCPQVVSVSLRTSCLVWRKCFRHFCVRDM